jgi:hypothetical protein
VAYRVSKAVRVTKRRNKYGVRTDAAGKRARTVDNIVFDSKAEADRYCKLRLLDRAGMIFNLCWQRPFTLSVNGFEICTYRVDFDYLEDCTDGSRRHIYEDVKGVRTRDYIIKKNLMKALHGIDIVEVRAPARTARRAG